MIKNQFYIRNMHMSYLSYNDERTAKENIEKSFNDIKWRHTSLGFNRAELSFSGIPSIDHLLNRYKSEIDDLIRYIEQEEKSCDYDLQRYCPDFYESTNTSRTISWRAEKNSNITEQEKAAKERIQKAEDKMNSYISGKSKEVVSGFAVDVEDRNNHTSSKFGPWGTEIRRRIATATGLKNEVNNLFDLGLNSIANSKTVYLGDHFIELIKADPAMASVISRVESEIIRDIKNKAYQVPYLDTQKINGARINGSQGIQLGGQRTQGDMLEQLKFTIKHPSRSYERYPETWNAAMNELTWSIRSCSVKFKGTYHAVYNVYGFAFVWEIEFSIEDTLDLRPSSGQKIDFSGNSRNPAYNIINSVLGTMYHDILGNTDKLKVRVYWNNIGTGNNQLYRWE